MVRFAAALAIVLASFSQARATGKLLAVVDNITLSSSNPVVALAPVDVRTYSEISVLGTSDSSSSVTVYVYFMSAPSTAEALIPKNLAATCVVNITGFSCNPSTVKVAGPYLALQLQLQHNDVITLSLKAWATR